MSFSSDVTDNGRELSVSLVKAKEHIISIAARPPAEMFKGAQRYARY